MDGARATASVPAPNMVQLYAPTEPAQAPMIRPDLDIVDDPVPAGGVSVATLLQVGAGVALVLLVLFVKAVIW